MTAPMRLPIGIAVALCVAILTSAVFAQLTPEEQQALDERLKQPEFGDPLVDPSFRSIFVLVDYSNTNFFIDAAGKQRGFEYELMSGYEDYLNRNAKKTAERRFLAFIPMPFEEILPALREGRGDIAAAGLTITEERLRQVDFTLPYIPHVNEIVVQHESSPLLESLEDLAGESVLVLGGSSYVEHLTALNAQLRKKKYKPIDIVEADKDLETAGILELVNSGAVPFSVVDDYVARIWSEVFVDIELREDLVVNSRGSIAWAVRKDSPELKNSLDDYVKQIKKGTLLGNIAFNRYFKSTRWVRNALDPTALQKLDKISGIMRRYSDRYGWDWIAVAAQAFQESRLDQSKVSPAGAIGIMQLLPSTAAQKTVGINDVSTLENNIHAGVKYLVFLRRRYFSDPDIAPANRVDFSWAAYNAGPAKIQRLRRIAGERGYDPNRWFGHVELVAADVIGRETVDYVANVNKYYVTYKYALERRERLADPNGRTAPVQ
jgi:membrane-bound lytic murein transglycosylase MltF